MPKIVLEVEAMRVEGVFGSSLGTYGYLQNNPIIAEVPFISEVELVAHRKFLDAQNIPYKVNGQPHNGASW